MKTLKHWGAGILCCVIQAAVTVSAYGDVTLDASRSFTYAATDFATHPNYGAPVLQTMSDPSFEDEFGLGSSVIMTRVSISFQVTRANAQTFTPTSTFNLGAVEFRFSGSEDPTTNPNNDHIYSLHLYDLGTSGAGLPNPGTGGGTSGNYRPSTDAIGGDLFSDVTFEYVTTGTEDRMGLLTFDGNDVVQVEAGRTYALEIWPNANAVSPDTHNMYIIRTGGDGTYTGGNIYSSDGSADPGNTAPFGDPVNLRSWQSGGNRDAPMALYAAPTLASDGDFDDDGDKDAADIDILWHIIRQTGADPNNNDTPDLDGSGLANEDDVDFMLAGLLTAGTNRAYGDANLSGGTPELTDYNLWRTGTGGWANGDFDGSGGVPELNDYNLWRTGPTQFPGSVGSHGPGAPGAGAPLVPEPATLVLMGLALPALLVAARRRKAAM